MGELDRLHVHGVPEAVNGDVSCVTGIDLVVATAAALGSSAPAILLLVLLVLVGRHDVRVNAISPGFFMTPLNQAKMSPARKETALRRTPMHRFGKLDELVGAAIYLASPSASYVTGETICVDGGFLAAGLD
jgi:enoyl-[acyl-carrier-protein] reductase (NADH)